MKKSFYSVKEAGRIGGETRAKSLTPERRLEIARKGSAAALKWRQSRSKEEVTEIARKANLASQKTREAKKNSK